MTHVIVYIYMISIYKRIESITMNSNTECYTSGSPALTRTMSNAPPGLTRTMSNAPPGLTRTMSAAPPALTRTMSTAPPGLTRTMSAAPSTDMDIQLDLGEGSEYDTMRDIGGMKQLGLASSHEISIFNEYVYQLKSQHAATCNMLEELGERGWLIQNSHVLTRTMSTAPPALTRTMSTAPHGLAHSVTISIPSAMDVDQTKGPIALTRSVNIANDIFGFTQTESPIEPNFGVKMDVDVGTDMDPDMSIEEE